MDSLLMSRMNKDVSPTKLQNLSPDKYGKAAWAELTYTPSKLANNILFREVVTLKKTEEGSSKLRELQAMNGFIKERMSQLELERDGIERSLTQQIAMYKKMLHESDNKNELRLFQIQKRFSSQISMLIKEKEEEAKFSQAQQEMLEDRIAQLQAKLKDNQEREASLSFDYAALKGDYEKQCIESEHLRQGLNKVEKQRSADREEWRRSREDLNEQIKQIEKKYQNQFEGALKDKIKEKEAMERLMKTELQKLQNIRMSENLRKTQEIRDVMATFQNESKRLNEIISMKDRMIQSLTIQNTKNKQNILDITTNYENRVNNLTHNRNDLTQQVEKGISHIGLLQSQLENQIASRGQEKERLGQVILELKQELERIQINYIRDRDQFQYWGADIEKENIMLKSQNNRIADVMAENERLSSELKKLRDLLVQSSFQIERSKEELIRMAFDRDTLSIKVDKTMSENERLFRMARDVEEESSKRRSSYYTQKRPCFR